MDRFPISAPSRRFLQAAPPFLDRHALGFAWAREDERKKGLPVGVLSSIQVNYRAVFIRFQPDWTRVHRKPCAGAPVLTQTGNSRHSRLKALRGGLENLP